MRPTQGPSEAIVKAANGSTSIIDDLIERFSPPADIVTVRVGDKDFSFRVLVDRAEFRRLQDRSKNFCKGAKPETCPVAENKSFYDTDDETKGYAFLLAEMSLEPKLDALSLLKLAKKACWLFEEMKDGYLLELASTKSKAEVEGLENAKNE